MTHGLVLTQNNAPLSSSSVQKGSGKANASGLKDQRLFQHLLDVLSSSSAKVKSDLNPGTSHAKQNSAFHGFLGSMSAAQGSQKKAASESKMLTVQVRTGSQPKKSPLKLQTGSFIYVGDLKRAPSRVVGKNPNNSASVSAGKVSSGDGKPHGADGKKHGAAAPGHKGQPLLGFLMMPFQHGNSFLLLPHTVLKKGATEATAKVQSQVDKNGSAKSIVLRPQTSSRPSKGPVGTNGLVAMAEKLTKVPARVMQQNGQLTLAGFPVEKVRLVQSQAVKTSASLAGTAHDIALPQGGQVGTNVTGSNLIQSPASAKYSKLAAAAVMRHGKENSKNPASNQAAATVMSGQQQAAAAPAMNAAAGSAVVNIQDQQVYQQFAAMIHQQVQAGSQTLHIQVHPQGLGSITVAIGQQNQQGLAIQVSATNPATAAWLQQESSQLTQALQSAGVHVANLQVNVSQQQGRGQSDSRSGQKKGSKTHELGRIRGVSQDTAQRTQPVVPVLDSRQSTISLKA